MLGSSNLTVISTKQVFCRSVSRCLQRTDIRRRAVPTRELEQRVKQAAKGDSSGRRTVKTGSRCLVALLYISTPCLPQMRVGDRPLGSSFISAYVQPYSLSTCSLLTCSHSPPLFRNIHAELDEASQPALPRRLFHKCARCTAGIPNVLARGRCLACC